MIAGSTVLVTGGAGTIGSHVVDSLIRAGAARITVLDNLVRGSLDNLPEGVTVVRGDILDEPVLRHAMTGADIVFHLAALRITQCAEDPRLAHDVLATGTLNVAQTAVDLGVRRIIASSSASVYGLASVFPTGEDHHPWANDTIYGAAKVYNEGILSSFGAMYGLQHVSLRYFNVYGPRMDAHGKYTEVLIRWMERIADGLRPIIFGDGRQTMDFVDVRDIARANILAATAPIDAGAYNIASGVETSLRDLAIALATAMGRPDLLPDHAEARAVNGVTRRQADTSAAARDLGFVASIPLDRGLRDLVEWWSRTQSSRGNRAAPLVTEVPAGS